jgi:hypothetical protein
MLANFLPLVDWSNGVLSAIIMFAVFLALTIALIVFMTGGKKKKD